jgi:hypothetical protein
MKQWVNESMNQLEQLYFHDPRLTLVPIEHLAPDGMSPAFAGLARAWRGWSRARVDLFNCAFSLYWERTSMLARRARSWAPPRLRHVAIVEDPLAVRPYAQLLNTSAWTLYDCDLDPARSHPELVAYLLVHGDRMALTGEVTLAALRSAAYWFERSGAECEAYAAAAARSPRPDAEAFRALAAALPWLRELAHETLRPPPVATAHRPIPGTGLLVPRRLESAPPQLVERWTEVARATVDRFHARWRHTDAPAASALCEWLSAAAPPLLLVAGKRIVWDPEAPRRLGALRNLLRQASGTAVRDVDADLRVIDAHTRAFLARISHQTPSREHAAGRRSSARGLRPTQAYSAVCRGGRREHGLEMQTDPRSQQVAGEKCGLGAAADDLPPPARDTAQSGYAYMHRTRRLIAYNLHEEGMERLEGPALPYARAMLGARTVHEWAHLAVDAGWVPCVVAASEWEMRMAALAATLDDVVAGAPAELRAQTREDLAMLRQNEARPAASAGVLLCRLLLKRMPDYQANLLACRFLSPIERETYVRHNIRTLRDRYGPAQRWRMLIRYLTEYQYLRFSAVADARTFFVRSTWFDADFFASGLLDEARFDELAAGVARLCDAYAVDEHRLRLEPACPHAAPG